MARSEVFVDTAALIALVNADDQLHPQALAVQADLGHSRTRLVTSEWVLTEFLGFASGRLMRQPALHAVQEYLASPNIVIVPASHRAWLAAVDLYKARSDKEWSLVDCASILSCQSRRIRRVFTHDRHFKQAGFEIML